MARLFLSLLLASTLGLAQTAAPAKVKSGSIAGTIVRSDNSQPIKRAKLTLQPGLEGLPASISSSEIEAVMRDRTMVVDSDEAGHFTFPDVAPGKYRIMVEKPGFLANDANIRAGGMHITLAPADALRNIQFAMRPAGAITGRVLNEDGEPMVNVNVEALVYSYIQGKRKLVPQGQAATNDLGEYRIFTLMPRKYYLRASVSNDDSFAMVSKRSAAKGTLAYWPTYFPDARSENATPLEVKPSDEARANFNLVPARGYFVSGKVLGLPGPAKSNALSYGVAMLVTKDAGDSVGNAMLSPGAATFSIGPVPPGEYELIAFSAEVNGAAMGEPNVSSMRVGHDPVKVANADLAGVNISLEKREPLHVAGKIRVSPAPPTVPDLSHLYLNFDFSDEESEMDNTFADLPAIIASQGRFDRGAVSKDGSFKSTLSPTSGVVHAHLNASDRGFEDYYTKSVLLGGHDVTESGFSPANLTPGTSLEIIVSPDGGRIEGTVVDSDKKPVASAFVTCVPKDPTLREQYELYVNDTTNQQGHYVLRGLRPGSYKLYAFDQIDQGAVYSPEFLKPFEDMGESIAIEEKGSLTKDLQVLHASEE